MTKDDLLALLPWPGSYSRECLVIEVATSLPAARVVQVLEVLTGQRGHPDGIVLGNGPEFIAHVFLRWAARTGITLDFIGPGKPVENAFVESFNGKFRDECLNQHWRCRVGERPPPPWTERTHGCRTAE